MCTSRQPCGQCSIATNTRLCSIEEKLNLLLTALTALPELDNYKSRSNQLEEENKSLQTSLQYAHAEIEDLKVKADVAESQQQKIYAEQGWIDSELKELQSCHIKLEWNGCRGNLNFLEWKSKNANVTATLRWFYAHKKLKIPPKDVKKYTLPEFIGFQSTHAMAETPDPIQLLSNSLCIKPRTL